MNKTATKEAQAVREHRIFAALYDAMFKGIEKHGMSQMRNELIRHASGRTLEIGAGTGFNLPHYPSAVTELVLTEPDRYMASRLRKVLESNQPRPFTTELVETVAEELPFDSESFDTAVSTLVFCSVHDPVRAAREAARVLRPGGRLLVLEHVRSPDDRKLAAWQDRLQRPWGCFFGGCHPNRMTESILEEAGLRIDRMENVRFPKGGGPLVRPMIRGVLSRNG